MLGTTLGALLSGRTAWLQARHSVLAQNIANADTPGYQPRDLAEKSFRELLQRQSSTSAGLDLARTETAHLPGATTRKMPVDGRKVDGFETAPSGNAVVLEEQTEQLAATQMQFALGTGIYSKMVGLMRTAIGNVG